MCGLDSAPLPLPRDPAQMLAAVITTATDPKAPGPANELPTVLTPHGPPKSFLPT